MGSLIATATGSISMLAGGAACAQNGNMMDGGDMREGGWMGGHWMRDQPIVAVGAVVWATLKRRK